MKRSIAPDGKKWGKKRPNYDVPVPDGNGCAKNEGVGFPELSGHGLTPENKMKSDSARFAANGFIDTLEPIFGSGIAENKKGTTIPTSSYSAGHYDKERPIPIFMAASSSQRSNSSSLSNEFQVWEMFEPYIQDGLPVKIKNPFHLRDVPPDETDVLTVDRNFDRRLRKCSKHVCEKLPNSSILSEAINFPTHVLDTKVTVQCQVANPNDEVGGQGCNNGLQKEINEALTVVPFEDQDNNTAMFFGQEDQMIDSMTMRDVMDLKFNSKEKHICIAQESVLSSRSDSNKHRIACNPNGQLFLAQNINFKRHGPSSEISTKTRFEDDDSLDQPLAALQNWIRAPSFLLPSLYTKIREVNFWYAPHNSVTNTHYDGNHNILMVLNGRKTVELSPPGSIQPSVIHSEHANHPKILRPSFWNEIETNRSADSLKVKLQQCREERNRSTIVVLVSAGEALFIPEGWWHRVESTSNCVAINIWFDHVQYSVQSITQSSEKSPHKRHLLPYQAREIVRIYMEEHFDDAMAMLLRQERKKLDSEASILLSSNNPTAFHQISTLLSKNDILDGRSEIIDSLAETFSHIIYPSDSKAKINQLENTTSSGSCLSCFLLCLDLNSCMHRVLAMNVIGLLSRASFKVDSGSFASTILSLKPGCCFVLSRLWEIHAETSVEGLNQVKGSCTSFYEHCGHRKSQVLAFIQAGVDTFRLRVGQYLFVERLALY